MTDRRMAYINLEDDPVAARMNGAACLRRGSYERAWRWFKRYDHLVLLAIARGQWQIGQLRRDGGRS
jgi:hypothetical protein